MAERPVGLGSLSCSCTPLLSSESLFLTSSVWGSFSSSGSCAYCSENPYRPHQAPRPVRSLPPFQMCKPLSPLHPLLGFPCHPPPHAFCLTLDFPHHPTGSSSLSVSGDVTGETHSCERGSCWPLSILPISLARSPPSFSAPTSVVLPPEISRNTHHLLF